MNAHTREGDSTAPVASPIKDIDLSDILRVISERRYIIIGVAVLGLLAGIVASLMMTPLYRSTAVVELNAPEQAIAANAASTVNAPAPRANGQEAIATQMGLLRSDSLARRVVQDLNLAAEEEYGGAAGSRSQREQRAVAIVKGGREISSERNSMLIEISYIHPDPVQAARIANALADAYIASSLERRYRSSDYARDFLNDQIERTRSALEQSEQALNAFSITSGIFRTPSRTSDGQTTDGDSLAVANLSALNDALNEARIARITAEQAYRGYDGEASDGQDAVSGLRATRASLVSEYEQKSAVFKEDYPEMRELRARIEQLDREIARETTGNAQRQLGTLRAAYRTALTAENELEKQVAELKQQVQGERNQSTQYNILSREVETNRALYDALLQRYKEIGVAGGIGRSDISLVDAARAPSAPFKPDMPLNALIGLAVGIGLGVLGAIVAHLLFDTVVTPDDVRNKLGLRVIGVIPEEDGYDTAFDALQDPKSSISEAYFSARTALRFAEEGGAPDTLLITSTRPGEGKSTTSYALAKAFASVGTKVLLVDADLRKPTFISAHGGKRGLAQILSSDRPYTDAVEQSQVANLDLLPVGDYTGSAAELLSSARLPHLIAQWRQDYDLVVVDGPPVLGFTDAPLLGALIDRTIVVIESALGRSGEITETLNRLRASGTHLMGAVLTKAQGRGGYGYTYYSYEYGDDHDKGGRVSSEPGRSLDISSS